MTRGPVFLPERLVQGLKNGWRFSLKMSVKEHSDLVRRLGQLELRNQYPLLGVTSIFPFLLQDSLATPRSALTDTADQSLIGGGLERAGKL
ncbi:hypothetical protein CRUP_034796 [Coryphaenoides rupestris]|nr:hypothetical protein CRUP_034796 [Coryphaenoides rupestris]